MFIQLFQNIASYLHFPYGQNTSLPELIIGNYDEILSKNNWMNDFMFRGKRLSALKKINSSLNFLEEFFRGRIR